eukprot:CAMPEP_0176452982 /NCGR_PEP_ID=MMETSP0127-20121128/28918_1 /TAXON_ID=938130 /ORGANISM="Platyophrya macrostoma, Strain WH" /LENGTH=74 /DNA_ID=CAMNT_0017841657 /DNA_START=204 /DNA_END=428 /DNA_ORIENTATION=-
MTDFLPVNVEIFNIFSTTTDMYVRLKMDVDVLNFTVIYWDTNLRMGWEFQVFKVFSTTTDVNVRLEVNVDVLDL